MFSININQRTGRGTQGTSVSEKYIFNLKLPLKDNEPPAASLLGWSSTESADKSQREMSSCAEEPLIRAFSIGDYLGGLHTYII